MFLEEKHKADATLRNCPRSIRNKTEPCVHLRECSSRKNPKLLFPSNFPLYRSIRFVSFRFVLVWFGTRASSSDYTRLRSSVEAVRIATNREQPPPGAFSPASACTRRLVAVYTVMYMYLLVACLVSSSSSNSVCACVRATRTCLRTMWARGSTRVTKTLQSRGRKQRRASLPQRASPSLFFVPSATFQPASSWLYRLKGVLRARRRCLYRGMFATFTFGLESFVTL